MRVVLNGWFLAHHPHTGTGQYLQALVEWLPRVAPEHEYLVVVPTASAAFPAPRFHSVPCSASNLGKLYFEQVLFPRACRTLRADLAHVPHWAPPVFTLGIPLIVTIHDLIPRLLPEYRGSALVQAYTALASFATPRAALVLADSEASRRDIVRVLRLPPGRVRAVLLAAAEAYTPARDATDEALQRRYELPARYGLYLGGFDARKNVGELLRAWAQAKLGPLVPLVLAGKLPQPDGRLFADYPRLAQELGLGGSVKFIGHVAEADTPALYRGAAVFAYPSRYEGFGLPPLEALACGTPVVTTPAGSLPEVVGEAAHLVPPDDAAALGAALRAVLTQPELAAALRARGLTQAKKFSWPATARETARAYTSVH